MGSILHLNRLIALSIIFFIILPACHRNISKGEKAAPEIIIIIGADVASHKLIIRDKNGNRADTFRIAAGKQIQWLLVNKEVIKELTNIYKKPESEDVFRTGPERISGSLNWRGTIDREAKGKTENYNIDWTDSLGNKHTFDPKIQVML